MRALSLWQPWASLIVCGLKEFETRSWGTTHQGPLLICAAKRRFNSRELEGHSEIVKTWYSQCEKAGLFGKALGVVDLTDCISTLDVPLHLMLKEIDLGDFSAGRFAWKLENVRVFKEPWSIVGHQGLFDVPDEEIAKHEFSRPA